MIIHLQDVHFFGYHGVYQEEQILGANYVVNVKVLIQDKLNTNITLDATVNYEEIYNIVATNMRAATPLLETLVVKIGTHILEQYLIVTSVDVSIYKINPPIIGYIGNVGVQQIFKK